MKLEVGMYVRTKDGYINKILLLEYAEEKRKEYPNHPSKSHWRDKILLLKSGYWRTSQNIIKASHNIIDLIEVGDYVNGCYVSNRRASVNEHLGGHPKGIGIIKCNAYFNQGNYDECKFVWIEEKDIKSIVTKEQFSQISYNLPKDK